MACGAGLALLVVLAGCAGHFLVQRDPWRKDAEIACMKSGAVRETGTIVRIEPINGPGMCGADFPLKVAALGDSAMLGYSGDLRPPGNVPNAGPQRWPVPTIPASCPRHRRATIRSASAAETQTTRRTSRNISNPMRQNQSARAAPAVVRLRPWRAQ